MHGRSVSPRKCNAMEKQWCGRKQRWKEQMQVQEGIVTCCVSEVAMRRKSNNAMESSARERNAIAVKSNNAIESSAGKVMQMRIHGS